MGMAIGAGMAGAAALTQALLGLFGSKEKPGEYGQQSALDPQQAQILQQLMGGMPLNQGMDAIKQQLSGYSPQNQLLERQFQQETMPGLAEQYGGLGAGSSSGFAQQAAEAGGNLATNMAAQQAQTQQSGIQNLMGMTGMGLGTQSVFPTYTPGEPSMAQRMAPALGTLGGAGTNLMGSAAFGNMLKNTQLPNSAGAADGMQGGLWKRIFG